LRGGKQQVDQKPAKLKLSKASGVPKKGQRPIKSQNTGEVEANESAAEGDPTRRKGPRKSLRGGGQKAGIKDLSTPR